VNYPIQKDKPCKGCGRKELGYLSEYCDDCIDERAEQSFAGITPGSMELIK